MQHGGSIHVLKRNPRCLEKERRPGLELRAPISSKSADAAGRNSPLGTAIRQPRCLSNRSRLKNGDALRKPMRSLCIAGSTPSSRSSLRTLERKRPPAQSFLRSLWNWLRSSQGFTTDRLARMCRVSVDIQGANAAPHRYARALQLWALGIGAVISGQYYGWQSALIAGFDGMLLVLCMVTVLYVMLSFSIAELSSTIPAGGGPYIFALHAIGPRAAFFSGLAETLKVIAVNASTFYTVYSYLQALFNVDVKFAPVFFIAFGILFLCLNVFGVQASFRMQACSTTLCVALLLIFFVASIPYLDYDRWVVGQHWEFTSLDSAIHAIPFAMWFYLGIEELPLASDETIEPEKNVPRGLLLCIVTLVFLSFGTATFSSLISPGAEAMANVSAPLVTSFQTLFGNGATTMVLKWLTVIALTSSPNSYIFFMGQLLFAIAKDRYFPKFLAYEHPTRGTAVGALVFGTIMCEVIAITLHYTIGDANLGSALINLTLLGALVSYVFQLLSYIYLAVRQPGRARPYRSPFGVTGAVVGIALCGVAIFAILYSSLSDTIFLASIVVTVLVFMVGSVYYVKHVEPQIKNNTLCSPAAPKGVREKIVKRNQAGYHTMAPGKTGLYALSEVNHAFSRE